MSTAEIIISSITVTSILLGVFYKLLKKWFLDLDTYKADKEEAEKNLQEVIESLKDTLVTMQKEKADAEDLAKTEKRIEKLDEQIAAIVNNVEKQGYRLDLLIESRNESVNQIKELRSEIGDRFKEIRTAINNQDSKIVAMQLDIQDLKSRLTM